MTKEEIAKEYSESKYDEYMDWVVCNYYTDDIDGETFEKAIKESIYEAYLGNLCQNEIAELFGEGDGEWFIDDYQVLDSDIKYGISEKLELED